MRRLAPPLALLLLCACTGPRPEAPLTAAVDPPPAWHGHDTADGAVEAAWWRAFGDPVLTRIVDQALANNTDVMAGAAHVAEARAQYRLAEAQRLPNVAFAAGGGRQRDVSPFGQPRQQTAGQWQTTAAYDLDLFGRQEDASEATRAALLATEAAHDSVRLVVAASAAAGYVGLRALDARLDVLKRTLAAREASLRLARRRAETGYAAQLDLAQAQAEYEATAQLIPATELAITRQEDGLSLLLGENPRAIERGLDLTGLTPPPVPAGLPADLLRRRPDIAQAEQQLVAADHGLDAARAAFLPDVQLSAAGGTVVSSLIDPVNVFTLGGSILAPLFDSGRLRAQADGAAARRDAAAFGYRKAALSAFREVEDGLASVQRSGEQEAVLLRQRDALARTLAIATSRYRAGYSPYLEQLDAERGLLSVELALVQSRADRLAAAITLAQALGGGWRPASL
ncbi:efflux transporter outer membrane subunit [Nitrospirillum viridazoti]|uniref:NodT family efflux transporter outer membrane factor (OMF) lipoprotein n=2 Tax=Nitrospirillum TaxID=1543705 RepID=A0A560IND1_9PROT|nr:efflux transporter outer membrane subunit [Nitrospirillum amazonense]TWB60552.1 NodT family efflux transporter outer membrane factor (OMF) lipoprotein [Nitrospirillum amazonense]